MTVSAETLHCCCGGVKPYRCLERGPRSTPKAVNTPLDACGGLTGVGQAQGLTWDGGIHTRKDRSEAYIPALPWPVLSPANHNDTNQTF